MPNELADSVDVSPASIVTPPPSTILIASSPSVYSIKGVCNEVVPYKTVPVAVPQKVSPPPSAIVMASSPSVNSIKGV